MGETAMLSHQPNRRAVVLLVDDEPAVLRMVEAVLANAGFTVLTAADGPEALKVSRDYPGAIHLLLTDVVMPEMDGPELAEKLTQERPRMRVLLMSGHSPHQIPEAFLSRLLQKPFHPRELLERIRRELPEEQDEDTGEGDLVSTARG